MFLIVLGVFSVIPFIIISFFNNPAADDFAFPVEIHNHGFIGSQIWWYNNWLGRYFSSFLMSINPLVFNNFFLFKLIPIFLIASLFFSLLYLTGIIFTNKRKRGLLLLPLCFIFIYLFNMPNIVEGIYWISGSLNYLVPNILTILLLCSIIKLMQTKKIRFLFLSVLLAFCVIGSNELSMLIIDFILASICGYAFIKEKKINFSLLILLVFAFIFSLVVYFSPGNTVRGNTIPNDHQFAFSAWQAAIQTINHLRLWLPLSIVFILIFFDAFHKHIKAAWASNFNVHPIYVFIVLCLILFIGFFTGYWSIGSSPAARTKNVICFFYVAGFLYLGFSMLFYLKKKEKSFLMISPWVRYVLFVIILIGLSHKNNISTAYADLIKGTAYRFDAEIKDRYEIIKNSKGEDCEVPKLKNYSATIGIADITPYPDCSRNKYQATYFGLKSIKTKEE
ncbi:MAG TPA: DUF6056 family protein [Bacteroidales bacterium]|nr:DUF6056 family protein [Bacteroidales bacterium]